jgi:hypothetical protein
MYVPERYSFHTFSDAAANDRAVTHRADVICCKVLEATANIIVNFLLSFACVLFCCLRIKVKTFLIHAHPQSVTFGPAAGFIPACVSDYSLSRCA